MNRLLFTIIFQFPILIFACSCIGKDSTSNAVKHSDFVFSGRVISKRIFTIQDDSFPLPDRFQIRKIEYAFISTKVYKGKNINDTIKIITGVGSGDCGFPFNVGNEYIVYANYANKYHNWGTIVEPYLTTHICKRTMVFNKVEENFIKETISKNKY